MRGVDRKLGVAVAIVCVGVALVRAQEKSPIDLGLAKRYFAEARTLSDRDAGRLWGRPLYGPMIFADPGSRAIVADRADQEGRLRPQGEVFVGTLPPEHNIANTAFAYAGVNWTMVMWPPPGDRSARGLLLMHELWHRIQDDLGFPSSGPSNAHLDTADGRIWLRLEWAALRKALQSRDGQRKASIEDALVFRARRRMAFSSATKEEQALEMHEGLANYTGVVLAGANAAERIANAIRELGVGEKKPTYVRSFAYASGPAYGVLLDDLAPEWRAGLTPQNNLGGLLGVAVGFASPTNIEAEAMRRSLLYDGTRITTDETEREKKRQEKLAATRAKLVEGPTLQLPLRHMKIQLDPDGVIPLDGLGTIYPTARIVDEWGVLTVTDGALVNANWTSVAVAAPTDANAAPLSGPGWTLDLSPGWTLIPGERSKDYRLAQRP